MKLGILRSLSRRNKKTQVKLTLIINYPGGQTIQFLNWRDDAVNQKETIVKFELQVGSELVEMIKILSSLENIFLQLLPAK